MKNKELADFVQRMINKSFYTKETALKEFKSSMLSLKKDLESGKSKKDLENLRLKALENYSKVRKRVNHRVLHEMFIDLKHKINDLK